MRKLIVAFLILTVVCPAFAEEFTFYNFKKKAAAGGGSTTWGPTAVSADANDGFTEVTTWRASNNPLDIGYDWGSDNYHGGFRFLNVTIPQGTTITSATLKLHAQANKKGAGTVSATLSCDAKDNAVVWSSSSRPPTTGYTATTATTAMSVSTWTSGAWYSYDITSAVQEVLNRVGWASGNSIRCAAVNTGVTNDVLHVTDLSSGSNGATLTVVY